MHLYEDRFMFHAEAVPFGARFADPLAVETKATTALPSVGGRVTASHCGYVADGGFIRFEAAGSEVVGEAPPAPKRVGVFTTRSTTWIRGLRIAGLLEIGELSVTLESRYEVKSREAPPLEPSFLRLAVRSAGLSVCRKAWDAAESPELAWIGKQPTFAHAREAFRKERARSAARRRRPSALDHVYCAGRAAAGVRRLVALTDPAAQATPERIALFGLTPPGLEAGLTIPSPRGDSPKAQPEWSPAVGGFQLDWPDGASVRFYFGEYVVTKGYRRFTAVRMAMTRSPESELVIGEVALNGAKHP